MLHLDMLVQKPVIQTKMWLAILATAYNIPNYSEFDRDYLINPVSNIFLSVPAVYIGLYITR